MLSFLYTGGRWQQVAYRTSVFILFCLYMAATASAQRLGRDNGLTVSVRELRTPTKAKTELEKSVKAYLKGNRAEARAHVERALEIYPLFANALAWRGVLHSDDDRFDESCADLEKAIEYSPNLILAYVALGRTYNNMLRWKDAQRVLEMGLRLNDELWQTHFEFARAEAGQQRFYSAMEHFLKAEQLGSSGDKELASLEAYILENIPPAVRSEE